VVPEDVLEESESESESEKEPEMASEPVPEVVPEEVPVEGVLIIAHAAAPSLPHGAAEASSPAPRAAAVVDAVASVAVEPEVIVGHPTFYAPDNIT
jgi:hypothetical protein